MEDHKILVVDDEPKIVRLLRANLESVGFPVLTAMTVADAMTAIEMESPDLVILDVMLPDGDGFTLCRHIREFSDVPVIMLTAKAREGEKLEGFRSGADDYVTKPFSSAELIARVNAVLKRRDNRQSKPQTSIQIGDITINFSQRKVFKSGVEVKLTSTEYSLLHYLAENAGRVMLHEELLGQVWGPEYKEELDYLRAYVRHLRRKIEDDPSNPRIIISSPGIGYSVASPESLVKE
jgi:two-component system, OmpR family, KDP operon response regulator KdpE